MTIKVEGCWNGHRMLWRLTLPTGEREYVVRETWDKEAATDALDLLENVYRLKRQNIRFQVV